MYRTTGHYHEVLNNVQNFIKLHHLPPSLGERVTDFVVSSWAISRGIDADKVSRLSVIRSSSKQIIKLRNEQPIDCEA